LLLTRVNKNDKEKIRIKIKKLPLTHK